MNKHFKRIIGIFLSIIMIFLLGFSMSGTALAYDDDDDNDDGVWFDISASGTCGENARYTFDSTSSTLTISGSGPIADEAFLCCYGFTNVIIEEGITEIGANAFDHSEIKSIDIGDSVTTIGKHAFYETELKTLSIGKGLKNISIDAFGACGDFKSITVSSDNPDFSSVGGVLFNKDATKLVLFPYSNSSRYCVPDGVKEIGEEAFVHCAYLKEIKFPESLITIGYRAFYHCGYLNSVTFSEGLQTIEAEAFQLCYNINSLMIPSTVTSIGDRAFDSLFYIRDVVLPEGLTSIGSETFNCCKNLLSVSIPESVTSIGDACFSECTSLKSVNLPKGLTYLGKKAFYKCSNFPSSIVIPDGVTKIGKKTFYGCTKLSSISLSKNLKSIGDSAFWGCELEEITIPDSVISIGDGAFCMCQYLKKVTIPDGVTSLGSGAFAGCYKLEEVILPDSVTVIDYKTFYECENLKQLTLGNYITEIGEKAFYGCISLTEFNIPDTVEIIGEFAWGFCYGLTTINIPANVKSIGIGALDEYNLTSITVDADNLYYASVDGVLFNKKKTELVRYPENKSGKSYVVPYGVTKIKNHSFEYCHNLKNITFQEGVTKIGTVAFYNCHLKTIELPASIRRIGFHAFYYTGLESVKYNGTKKQWWSVSNINSGIECKAICTNGIAWVHGLKLSTSSYVYNGRAKKPTVSMKNAVGVYLQKGYDYYVSYPSGRINVGKYTVEVTYRNSYKELGTQTLSFTIVPKGTSISSISASSKAFTVKWNKQTTQTTGYQIRYSRNSSMRGAKTATISKKTTLSKKVTGLYAKKKYYVQVRTYKSVNGAKYYSKWSGKKAVTTK